MAVTQNQLVRSIATLAALVLACSCLPLIDSTVEAVLVDCSGEHPGAKLLEVQVAGCNLDKDKECLFPVGKNASIEAKLEVLRPFSSARIQLYGIVRGGFKFPFHLKPDEACGDLYGFKCPSQVGQQETLHISLLIKKIYPRFSVKVQIKLVDENNKVLICVELPGRIVDSVAEELDDDDLSNSIY